MTDSKTIAGDRPVDAFLAEVEPEERRRDALALDTLFRRITGYRPRLWGTSMIGYGRYHYRYERGREGNALATGFAPRRTELVLYIMPGYTDFGPILARLGKHRLGKSCLYLRRMSDVDLGVLEELIRAGLADLGTRWTVHPE